MGGRPETPVQGAGPQNAPRQGDHVFGNIVGVLTTGLSAIIGGGQLWIGVPNGRFNQDVFDADGAPAPAKTFTWHKALQHWGAITALDLGHGAAGPMIGRAGGYHENDNHSLMFGGYSSIFLWRFCEIGARNGNSVNIGSESPRQGTAWVSSVLTAYDRTMRYLVDSTALVAFLANVNPRPQPQQPAPHTAISKVQANRNAAGPGAAAVRVRTICHNFDLARWELRQMLEAMSRINIYWDNTADRWINFA